MSKVITFSRTFPSNHPKRGKPTFFVEKILNSLGVNYSSDWYLQRLLEWNTFNLMIGKLTYEDLESFWLSLQKTDLTKNHTIRGAKRFKPLDKFSPRVWFGKPYHTPQIIFYDEITVKKVWNSRIMADSEIFAMLINDHFIRKETYDVLASNDGLTLEELAGWFKKSMNCQIVCWNQEVEYP